MYIGSNPLCFLLLLYTFTFVCQNVIVSCSYPGHPPLISFCGGRGIKSALARAPQRHTRPRVPYLPKSMPANSRTAALDAENPPIPKGRQGSRKTNSKALTNAQGLPPKREGGTKANYAEQARAPRNSTPQGAALRLEGPHSEACKSPRPI